MLLWAMAPAREPATSLSVMPNVSWLLPINRFIWQTGHSFFVSSNKVSKCDRNKRLTGGCIGAYLFIGHEFNSRLGGNFDDIDAVASPQWPHTAFSDHLDKASSDTHAVALGSVNLGRPESKQTMGMYSHWLLIHFLLYSLSIIKTFLLESTP